jgi:hypothetical protein
MAVGDLVEDLRGLEELVALQPHLPRPRWSSARKSGGGR